jgi:predicted MFS family arabinose efflux permease
MTTSTSHAGTDTQTTLRAKKLRHSIKEYLSYPRQFSRNARLFLLGTFLLGVNFEFFQLLLNLYLKELGLGEGNIGLINSSRAVGLTLMALPAAWLISRLQLKWLLIGSCVVFAVFAVGLTTSASFAAMVSFSILMGMAFTFSRVAAGPFFMRNSTVRERTHLFSFSFGVLLLAGMVGSQLGGRLVSIMTSIAGDTPLGYRYTLLVGVAIGLLSLIPFAMIKSSAPSADENRINLSRETFRARGKFYFKVTFANFLMGLGAGLIIPFLNLYFRTKFSLSPATIGSFYFCTVLTMFVGTVLAPYFARTFGLVRTIAVTQLISIPFMLLLAYTTSIYVAFTAYILRAGLMNIGVPITTNVGMELSEKNEQGLVNALLMIAWNGSWMLSTAIGGRLIETHGYTITFIATSGLYILSTLFYYWSFHKSERKEELTGLWSLVKTEEA